MTLFWCANFILSQTWLACHPTIFLSYQPHVVKKVAKWQTNHVCDNIKFAHQNWSHKSCDWPQFT